MQEEIGVGGLGVIDPVRSDSRSALKGTAELPGELADRVAVAAEVRSLDDRAVHVLADEPEDSDGGRQDLHAAGTDVMCVVELPGAGAVRPLPVEELSVEALGELVHV